MTSKKQNSPGSNRGVNPSSKLKISLKSLYSSVDWLTTTSDNPDVGVEWLHLFKRYKDARTPKGKKSREVSIKTMGFEGTEYQGLTWAYHPKSQWFMVIASGATASSVWHQFVPKAKNITRLDIAVTALLEDEVLDLAEAYYKDIDEDQRRQRGYTLMQNSRGGSTLYVGSRASQLYGRVYDKGAESGEYKPGYYWRYEVEIKKPQSYPLAMSLYDAWQKDSSSVPNRLAAYNHHWFYTRGVEPVFDPSEEYATRTLEVIASDVNTTLKWYRSSVRPSVKRLLEDGYKEEVLAALGLDDHVQYSLWDTLGQNPEDSEI